MVNPEDLEEGDDIYFSCSIKANPPAYKITWWHNVSICILVGIGTISGVPESPLSPLSPLEETDSTQISSILL
jgi:hypothetical protein